MFSMSLWNNPCCCANGLWAFPPCMAAIALVAFERQANACKAKCGCMGRRDVYLGVRSERA